MDSCYGDHIDLIAASVTFIYTSTHSAPSGGALISRCRTTIRPLLQRVIQNTPLTTAIWTSHGSSYNACHFSILSLFLPVSSTTCLISQSQSSRGLLPQQLGQRDSIDGCYEDHMALLSIHVTLSSCSLFLSAFVNDFSSHGVMSLGVTTVSSGSAVWHRQLLWRSYHSRCGRLHGGLRNGSPQHDHSPNISQRHQGRRVLPQEALMRHCIDG